MKYGTKRYVRFSLTLTRMVVAAILDFLVLLVHRAGGGAHVLHALATGHYGHESTTRQLWAEGLSFFCEIRQIH